MKISGNTILITGGGSGIGRGLAEALQSLDNRVIIAGRRKSVLQEVAEAHSGIEFVVFDQAAPNAGSELAASMRTRFPSLNVLRNNAGIQRVEDLRSGGIAEAEATINTNLLGPMRLTAALMQQLLAQPHAAILNVSSALAMLPAARMPSYCASKAAMHSYTQSLRYQLKESSIEVIEIIPPWVQTKLQGDRGMNPKAMPLKDYIAEMVRLLSDKPAAAGIVSERSKPMRFAGRGDYNTFFRKDNDGGADYRGAARGPAGLATGPRGELCVQRIRLPASGRTTR